MSLTDLGVPKAEKVEQNKELKIMLKWGKFFFDVLLVNRKFNIFIF